MANTYTQILYHIVFSTKNRVPAMAKDRREDLYKYIWGVVQNNKCHLYRLGGVEDHIHLLTSLHPTLALSKFVESIKAGSTNWIKREAVFSEWPGWQDGYGAFTVSATERDEVVEYIKNQEEHHQKESFQDEYRRLLTKAGIEFDERYLF